MLILSNTLRCVYYFDFMRCLLIILLQSFRDFDAHLVPESNRIQAKFDFETNLRLTVLCRGGTYEKA